MSHQPGDTLYKFTLDNLSLRGEECRVRVKSGVIDKNNAKQYKNGVLLIQLDQATIDVLRADIAAKVAAEMTGMTLDSED